MQNHSNENTEQQSKSPQPTARPNESGQLYIDDFLRIRDPNTEEIILEKRS